LVARKAKERRSEEKEKEERSGENEKGSEKRRERRWKKGRVAGGGACDAPAFETRGSPWYRLTLLHSHPDLNL
jgi:hypothetical protein